MRLNREDERGNSVRTSHLLSTPHRHSNEDFIVIISCCYVSSCPCDILCADPLSATELSSLMNLSSVNDSGWGNAVYKTGRRLVWVLCWGADTVGVDMGSYETSWLLTVGSCKRYQGPVAAQRDSGLSRTAGQAVIPAPIQPLIYSSTVPLNVHLIWITRCLEPTPPPTCIVTPLLLLS